MATPTLAHMAEAVVSVAGVTITSEAAHGVDTRSVQAQIRHQTTLVNICRQNKKDDEMDEIKR